MGRKAHFLFLFEASFNSSHKTSHPFFCKQPNRAKLLSDSLLSSFFSPINLSKKKMSTVLYTTCCLSGANNQQAVKSKHFAGNSTPDSKISLPNPKPDEESKGSAVGLSRRLAMASAVSIVSTSLGFPGSGFAVVKQGLFAGRVPGLSEPNEQGWRIYRRPDEKSGGHGVGWSPMDPYSFSVPIGWEEVPVSIADLGGTEIDLRFANSKEGRLFVIVAPVKRFSDEIDDNAKIEDIGNPDKVINAFGPEVIGENVEGKVLSSQVAEHMGRKYYQFELEPPHIFITATAAGNRLYLFAVSGNGLQWKRYYKDLKQIAESFRVV